MTNTTLNTAPTTEDFQNLFDGIIVPGMPPQLVSMAMNNTLGLGKKKTMNLAPYCVYCLEDTAYLNNAVYAVTRPYADIIEDALYEGYEFGDKFDELFKGVKLKNVKRVAGLVCENCA